MSWYDVSMPDLQQFSSTGLTRWGFGGGSAAPENIVFRPCWAAKSPSTGEKKQIAEGLQPSPPPGRRRPRKSCQVDIHFEN
jgi:hypothetical protein